MQRLPTTISILLVEDNMADIYLVQDALSDIHILNEISWARDGEEAMELIRANQPDMVILDTLLPCKSGFEVLEEIKSDPELKHTTVVMASGSSDLTYIKKQAPLADGYIKKPITLENLADVVSKTNNFAVAIVRT